MDRELRRREEMVRMRKNGIRGIKADFFGGDKQPVMQLYEDILNNDNDYGLEAIPDDRNLNGKVKEVKPDKNRTIDTEIPTNGAFIAVR